MKKKALIIAIIAATILLGILAVLIVSCNHQINKVPLPSASAEKEDHPEEAVGLWKLEHVSKDGTTLNGSEVGKFELELKPDGSGTLTYGENDSTTKTADITWSVKDEKMTINDKASKEEAEFDGLTITFPNFQGSGIQAVFIK